MSHTCADCGQPIRITDTNDGHYRFACGCGRSYNISVHRWDVVLAFLAMRKGATATHEQHPTERKGVSP
jgi:hypothetical protein